MTKEQIDKLIKIGERKKFTSQQLARYAMERPYSLCAADATIVMKEFSRRHPPSLFPSPSETAKLVTTRPVAPKRIACEDVTVKISAGFNSVEVKCIGAGGGGGNSNYTPSKLNRSSVKEYTLEVARQKRAGKWDRVGKSWTKSIEAELENVIRGIGGPADNDDIPGEWDFLNRKQIFAAVAEQLNRAVRRIILRKVRSYPTRGKTLK